VVPQVTPEQILITLSPPLSAHSRTSSTASLQLYVQQNDLPLPSVVLNNLLMDTTSNQYKYVSLIQPSSGNVYVGILNLNTESQAISYQLNYSFICPSGSTGATCETQIPGSGGISSLAVAFIIFIICLIAAILLVIGFLVFLRYNVIKGYCVDYFHETDPPHSEPYSEF